MCEGRDIKIKSLELVGAAFSLTIQILFQLGT